MTAAEQLFWAEVGSDKSTVRSVAVCYALLIAYAAGSLSQDRPLGPEFWRPVNAAVNKRFGYEMPRDVRKVDRLRKMAWDINKAACTAQESAA